MNELNKYINKFRHLRVDRSKSRPAPHKPILLLSIIKAFQKGDITKNRICITPDLVARFKDYFSELGPFTGFVANFSLPFYHLKSEGFWHFKLKDDLGRAITSSNSIKSLSYLKQVIEFVYLDQELFKLLISKDSREVLKNILLAEYFPGSELQDSNKLLTSILSQILNDPPGIYQMKAKNSDEDELFVRGGLFKREIPKIYNYTCAISGMRIITDTSIQMIDACHIVPFSESYDDTIRNGISLCPNLHRAFDRGLISLSNEYKVIVKDFYEDENGYSIRQFLDKEIVLPRVECYKPSMENLRRHRRKHGFEL